jgi:hypothetical protein
MFRPFLKRFLPDLTPTQITNFLLDHQMIAGQTVSILAQIHSIQPKIFEFDSDFTAGK